MAFCSKCGTQIPEGAKFCPACGTLNEVEPNAFGQNNQNTGINSDAQPVNTAQDNTVQDNTSQVNDVQDNTLQADAVQNDVQPESAQHSSEAVDLQKTQNESADTQEQAGAHIDTGSDVQSDYTNQQAADYNNAQPDYTNQQAAGYNNVQPDYTNQQAAGYNNAQPDYTNQQAAGYNNAQPDYTNQQAAGYNNAQPDYANQQTAGYNGQQGFANQYNGQQPQQKPKGDSAFKKFLHNKKAVGAVIAAVVVIIAAIVAVCIYNNNKKKVNLNDCLDVTFTGYDSFGKAKAEIDYDKLSEAYTKAKGSSKSSSDWSDILSSGTSAYSFYSSIKVKVSPEENLKNGDTVTVTITYDEERAKKAGIKVVAKEQTFTVEGLEQLKELDPFEGLEVEFKGKAPNGRANLTYNGSDGVLSSYRFKADKSSGLSNGDKITVSLTIDDKKAAEAGYKITQTSKEYTVSGLTESVTKCDEISDDSLSKLQKQASDYIDTLGVDESQYSKSENKYEGIYVLSSKKSENNTVYLVYSVTITFVDSAFDPVTVYMPVRFDDVYKDADGKVQCDDSYLNIPGVSVIKGNNGYMATVKGYTDGTKMFSDLITDNKANYNYDVSEGLKQFGN